MRSLWNRAKDVYREGGALQLAGRGLQFAGKSITSTSDRRRKEDIISNYRDSPRYLNVGGGDFVRDHWRVLDHVTDWYDYDEVFVDYDIDLEELTPWPIDDGTYDIVYTSHTLEHLSNDAMEHVLLESHRILKPDGCIRINVPDLDLALYHYNQQHIEWFTDVWREKYSHGGYYADGKCPDGYELEFYLLVFFASHLALRDEFQVDYPEFRADITQLSSEEWLDRYTERIRAEWQTEDPWLHRNWFTYERLEKLLADAGFGEIRRSQCRQSRHPELCMLVFDNHAWMSVYVEARKSS